MRKPISREIVELNGQTFLKVVYEEFVPVNSQQLEEEKVKQEAALVEVDALLADVKKKERKKK